LKQIAAVLLAFYFLFGSILLPGGEFNDLLGIPALYRHAQNINPKTISPFTFISDHLLNIDRILTNPQNSYPAKPDKLSYLAHNQYPGIVRCKT